MNHQVPNYYEHNKVKKFLKKFKNPSYPNTHMDLNHRTLIVGGSGTGKTCSLVDYIRRCENTFAHIAIVNKGIEEPLYEMLKDELKGRISFYTLQNFPPMNVLCKDKDKDEQWLVVYDDIVNDCKNDNNIRNYFIAGRKMQLSQVFLTQSYYQVPKIIRQQLTYILLLKLSSKKDLKLVLSDYTLGIEPDELVALHRDATAQRMQFLFIDINATDEDEKFSKGWNNFYKISQMEGSEC